MKTPKEKARELIHNFLPLVDWTDLQIDCTNKEWAIRNAKLCALIVIEEILKDSSNSDYWQEVKQEVIKYKL